MTLILKRTGMGLALALGCLVTPWLDGAADGISGNWCVASHPKVMKRVDLPPLAQVTSWDTSGRTWGNSGVVQGGLGAAMKDFVFRLDRQGWMLDKVMPLGKKPRRSELSTWQNGSRRLLLMLWEIEPGNCGFSIGEEDLRETGKSEPDKRSVSAFIIRTSDAEMENGATMSGPWRLASD